jgi:hypothetical protein
MTRRCVTCGVGFDARGDWQRRCWPCYRVLKERQEAQRHYEQGYRQGALEALRRQPNVLDPELLRDLIALTHPDRHPAERRELATRTTQSLLALRDSLGAVA